MYNHLTSLSFLEIPFFMCYWQAYSEVSGHKVPWDQCFNANWTAVNGLWFPFFVCECMSNVYPCGCLAARMLVPMNSICYLYSRCCIIFSTAEILFSYFQVTTYMQANASKGECLMLLSCVLIVLLMSS